MSSTYLSLHYHLVFSTKDRRPLILPEWRERLFEYMGGTIVGSGRRFTRRRRRRRPRAPACRVEGDTHCLADVVRELKKSATAWVRGRDRREAIRLAGRIRRLHDLRAVAESLAGVHPQPGTAPPKKSFRDGLISMLKKAGGDYDPRYLD